MNDGISGAEDPPADSAAALASEDCVTRTGALLARCQQHGFASAGIAPALPSDHADAYRAWIAQGKHGSMAYLGTEVAQRLDPTLLVAGAKSVLCVADRYADGRSDARTPGFGRIARYARGDDYHIVMRARLEALSAELRRAHPAHRFRVCVDTAPLMEREHAQRAGLGSIGKHTLLIAPHGLGSWIVLGAIVSTLEFAPSQAAAAGGEGAGVPGKSVSSTPGPDPCGSCTRCIDACPTDAISPWSVDATRCTSYLTIEARGALDPSFVGRTGDWLFGCDICQEVCPHAQPTQRARAAGVHEAYRAHRAGFPLLELLGWDEGAWQAAQLHGALRRVGVDGWRRNAVLAAASALRDSAIDAGLRAALRERLEQIAGSESESQTLRDAARGVLASD